MNKHLNMFILTVFLIGQLVLLPLQTMTAYAQAPANDENVLTVSEEQPATGEQASTDTTSEEEEQQASTTASVIVEQPEEQKPEAEAENNKPADADGQTPSGLSPPVEDSDNEGLPEGSLEGSPEQENKTGDSSTESGETTTEGDDGEDKQDPESKEEGDESITFKLTLDKLLLEDGSAIPEVGLDPLKDFQVHYNWSLDKGHAYKSGDQVTFQLPKQLQVFQEIPGTLEGEYATFVLSTDGKVTFTFTEAVENSSKINGTFWFMSKFDLSNTVIEDGNVILDTFEDGGTLQVPINTGDMAAEVHKTGQANKEFAPTEINWTVTVDPKSIMHKNGVVTDTLPDGLTLKEDSVKVNGEAASFETTGQQFTVSLGNFSSPQTITYTTTINEDAYDKTEFKNNATYKADGVTEVTKDATVHVKRGAPLTKEQGRYNPSDQTMEWTVNLNFNSKSMDEQTLTDSWGEASGVELIGDVELYEVVLDDTGKVDSTKKKEDLKATSKENGFTVQIPAIDTPHQIKYKTKLNERVETINNTVSWGSGEPQGNTGKATVKTPTKGVDWDQVDYKEKKVGWVITHNSIEAPIKNVTITDTLNDGLTYVEGSVKVTVGGQEVKDAKVEINGQTLTVHLEGKVEGEIKVTFNTHFDYSKVEKGQPFKNKANVTWTDEFGKQQNKDSTDAEFWPNDDTKNNGSKSGKYDSKTKEITWEVIVNYQQNHYKNLVVTDSPQGNQKIVADSVKVETVEVTSGGGITGGAVLEGDKPEVNVAEDILTVTIGETSKPIRITYKTTLEDATAIESSYTNKAQATENNDLVADLKATAQVKGGGEYVSKTGEQDGAVVDWTVVVNPQQANMSNVVLTDTISDNQEFLKDSVKVYTTEPGQTAAKDEYDASKYDVTFSDDGQTLTVKFENDIDRTYVVKYTTLHFAGHGDSVSNKYKVTGDNLKEGHKSGSTVEETIEQLAGGTSSGEVGYLKVKKVGSDKPEGLEGITFELIDPVSKRVLKEGTTDQEGLIDFGRLKHGKYELKEKNTLDGYIKPTENYEVEVNTKYNKEDESTVQLHTITNYKAVSYSLKKVDSETKESLEGVTFQLVDEKGEVIREGKTNNAGYLVFTNVPEGNYTFKEVQPLDGYQQLDKEVKAEAGTTVKVENVKKPTEPEEGDRCEDFTVEVKEDGKPVEKDQEYTFESEDGKTIVTEKTDENGKIVIDREKLPEGKYTVKDKDGKVVGDIVVEYEECGTELDITKPTEGDRCEDFTVTVKEDGKPVEKDTEYTFESEDGKTTVTEKTDENGKIVIDREKLPEGKYTVTDKDGNKVGEIEVEYDECGTELDITKPTEGDRCEDFTVEVKEDGKPVEKDQEYTFESEDGETKVTETTDENGKIVIDREKLPEGKYTVTDKDGNEVGEIEVEYDECGTELDITKPTEGDRCEDFTVVVKEDGKPVEKDQEYTFESEDGETKVTETTDENGKIVIDREKLPEGKYTVTDKDGNKVGEIEVEYDECGTELDITKETPGGGGGGTPPPTDPEEPTPVDPEEPTKPEEGDRCEDFTVVVKEDGKPVEKDTEYTFESEDGKTKVTDKTDENGKIVIDREKLPEGKYTVTDKDGNKVGEIEVEYDECGTELDMKSDKPGGGGGGTPPPTDPEEPTPVDPENPTPVDPEQELVNVTLIKHDLRNEDKRLENAQFDLFKVESSQDEKVGTYTTSDQGTIVVTDLPKADYYFVEVKAPIGYVLDETKQHVVFKEGSQTGQVKVSNKRKPISGGGGTPPPTDPEEPTPVDPEEPTPVDPEEPTKPEEGDRCEDFTVEVKEDGKPVEKDTEYTFESEDGETKVTETTDENGKIVIDREKLPEGKYTVTDKDGNKVGEIEVEYDECGTELDITTEQSGGGGGGGKEEEESQKDDPVKPTTPEEGDRCEDFTVTIKENGKPVNPDREYTFESEDGKVIIVGKTDKDGNIIIDRDRLPEGKYTVKDKDGNIVGEIEVEYDDCRTELDYSTETPGTPGEETPGTPGEETPGTPGEETPGTPGEETPGTPGEETPGTPGEETPGTPGEETPGTPGEETPGTPGEETPGTSDGKDRLPQTGEQLYIISIISGIVLLLIGFSMLKRRRVL